MDEENLLTLRYVSSFRVACTFRNAKLTGSSVLILAQTFA